MHKLNVSMHKPSLLRKKEDNTNQSSDSDQDVEHQDRLAKVLMYHSKGFNQSDSAQTECKSIYS